LLCVLNIMFDVAIDTCHYRIDKHTNNIIIDKKWLTVTQRKQVI